MNDLVSWYIVNGILDDGVAKCPKQVILIAATKKQAMENAKNSFTGYDEYYTAQSASLLDVTHIYKGRIK
nr:MAG TPA: hypothetical protein [Caudoviricetes sp.]